ncbi:hypothetical protein Tco_0060465 [Tanacetum coccineum]
MVRGAVEYLGGGLGRKTVGKGVVKFWRVHGRVQFLVRSFGSGLTADSSVLTLTLAILDFGLDFAQSFPFHAQFCHFGWIPTVCFTYPRTCQPATSRKLRFSRLTCALKDVLLNTPKPGCKIRESSILVYCSHQDTGPTLETDSEITKRRMRYQPYIWSTEGHLPAVRAEIEIEGERLAYDKRVWRRRQSWLRSEAHCRALEARVTVLETEVHRHEWQRQAADDLAVQHIKATQP